MTASVPIRLLALLGIFALLPQWLCALLITAIIAISTAFYYLSLQRTPADQIAKFLDGLQVGGHRGCSADAPENTIQALRLAHEHGAQAVEFDIEFTKDNVPVLLHDSSVDRTTNGTGAIASLTWQQVQLLDAHANFDNTDGKYKEAKIPKLDDAVHYCVEAKIKIFFDVKAPDSRAVEALLQLYDRYSWLYDNAAVCSFHPSIVYRIKRRNSRIITGHTWRRWGFSTNNLASTIPRYTGVRQHWATLVDMINVWSLHSWLASITAADLLLTNRLEISASYVQYMYERTAMRVVAWTVNDEREQLYLRDSLRIPYLTDRTSTTQRLNSIAAILNTA